MCSRFWQILCEFEASEGCESPLQVGMRGWVSCTVQASSYDSAVEVLALSLEENAMRLLAVDEHEVLDLESWNFELYPKSSALWKCVSAAADTQSVIYGPVCFS